MPAYTRDTDGGVIAGDCSPAGRVRCSGWFGRTGAHPRYLASNGTCLIKRGSMGDGFVGRCRRISALTSSNAFSATAGRGVLQKAKGAGLSRVREDHQALAEVQQLRDQNLFVEVVRSQVALEEQDRVPFTTMLFGST